MTMSWRVIETLAGNVIAKGTAHGSLSTWHSLELDFKGTQVQASLDGKALGGGQIKSTKGMIGLASGLNLAEFDNFAMSSGFPA